MRFQIYLLILVWVVLSGTIGYNIAKITYEVPPEAIMNLEKQGFLYGKMSAAKTIKPEINFCDIKVDMDKHEPSNWVALDGRWKLEIDQICQPEEQ